MSLAKMQVDAELTARRAAQPGFIGPSFATIAGAGPNGAVIHYRPQPGSCRTVDSETLLLLDSGGQYECGEEGAAGVVVGGTNRNMKGCSGGQRNEMSGVVWGAGAERRARNSWTS